MILLIFTVIYGKIFVSNDINRVFLLMNVVTIFIGFLSGTTLSGLIIFYYVVSSVMMIALLMKTLFAKHGLTEKITGETSNFFR